MDEVLYEGIRDDFGDAFERWREVGAFEGYVVSNCPRYTLLCS
jgi:hypothetical protein